ncbi:unnamed protein product [Parnassius apollo]|uniref:(apollo) hypothetical protein n=1 Tax=Parnassius apollo TaxID=110799 RepID=A0A8S3W6G2_PARAO|nr:unnamed protein product [Parnassius apollo]
MESKRKRYTFRTRASPHNNAHEDRFNHATSMRGLPGPVRARLKTLLSTTKIRFANWNIGTLTGRSTELAAILARRKVAVVSLQETRWKANRSWNIGHGYKLIYTGSSGGETVWQWCLPSISTIASWKLDAYANPTYDELSASVQKLSQPWLLMCADDIALVDGDKGRLTRRLHVWREALENGGLKLNVAKTEYMAYNSTDLTSLLIGDDTVERTDNFRYLGSVLDASGDIDRDIKARISAA